MKNKITIIGAGATGLSSAIFLNEKGFDVQIFEKRERANISKALAINPKTLTLFEKFGITERFISNGRKLEGFCIWSQEELILDINYSLVHHKYPFMIIQPQFETENILEEYLSNKNIHVTRGIDIKSLIFNENQTKLRFEKNETLEEIELNSSNIIIGADGSKSNIREEALIKMNGWEHKDVYCIYDAELDTRLPKNKAHLIFHKEGTVLLINIRDNIWRIGGNLTDSISHLPKGTILKQIIWKSEYIIQEKVAEKLNYKNVFILGDAAHIHSPVGGKGMNLCFEDSYLFSEFLSQNRQSEFSNFRLKKLKKNVSVLAKATEMFGGKHFIGNTIRSNIKYSKKILPLIAPKLVNFILDIE